MISCCPACTRVRSTHGSDGHNAHSYAAGAPLHWALRRIRRRRGHLLRRHEAREITRRQVRHVSPPPVLPPRVTTARPLATCHHRPSSRHVSPPPVLPPRVRWGRRCPITPGPDFRERLNICVPDTTKEAFTENIAAIGIGTLALLVLLASSTVLCSRCGITYIILVSGRSRRDITVPVYAYRVRAPIGMLTRVRSAPQVG